MIRCLGAPLTSAEKQLLDGDGTQESKVATTAPFSVVWLNEMHGGQV